MKSIFVLLLLTLCLGLVKPDATQQQKQDCIKSSNVSAAEAKQITDGTDKDITNASKELKCYQNCLYQKLGLLTVDGKPSEEAIIKFVQSRYKSAPADKIKQVLSSCASSKGDTNCDFVYNYEKCSQNGFKALQG